ncbi:MAG: DHH family phosphoesterase, partial [Rickettsiales bacterium]|nr:DHH family phosphoesterase [Rickettsiales bacterium]
MLNDLIKNAETIVIIAHKNLDGDALGAVLAMGHFIRNVFNKDPILAHEGVIPDNLRFMSGGWWLKKASDLKEQIFDLAIVLDTADINVQVDDDARAIIANAKARLKIDHHPNSVPLDGENIILQTSATCEIIANIAIENDWEITADIAKFLYTGIYTDTGGFVHDYTTGATLRLAALMMEKGARQDWIARRLNERPMTTFLNNAETLARTLFSENKKIGYTTFSVKKNSEGDRPHRETGWLHANILAVKEIDASVIFKELDAGEPLVHISLRSKYLPINGFAESF